MSRETLRARVAAATEGPWETLLGTNGYVGCVLPDGSGRDLGQFGDSERPDADGAFIAHARQDIPALLAVADAAAGALQVASISAAIDARQRLVDALDALEALP